MTLLPHFFHTAIDNLRRGGQRVRVALLCIAFGVMSVVAMTLLAESLRGMLIINPQFRFGADVSSTRKVEDTLQPADVAALDALQKAGKIQRYTLMAYSSSVVFSLPGSGELHFPAAGMGIDPAVYPLAGPFKLRELNEARAASLLQQPDDILVTRDLMDANNLKVGDTLRISDLHVGAVVEGTIRGVVSDTPNHQGSKVYYSMDMARRLAGVEHPENTALANSADPVALAALLGEQGWQAFSGVETAGADAALVDFFDISFKGAGVLGMLVGGIGIANTMQVLLRRRRREVAVLKTLGYTQGQLQLMFVVEAALLGVLGSALGAGLGVAVSSGLVNLFQGTTNLLVVWSFSPLPVITGLLMGIITTVSFALFAIVITSRVRPLALLRNEELELKRVPWTQAAGLALLCGLPFGAATSLVMGSLLKGVGVLLFALAGLVALGGLLGGLAWLVTKALPLRNWPLAHMARNSLRRRGPALTFAMIALFVGVVSLSLGEVVLTSSQRELDEHLIAIQGDNINIVAQAAQESTLRQAVEANPLAGHVSRGYQTQVRAIRVTGTDQTLDPLLIARDNPQGYQLKGAEWGSQPGGVYAYRYSAKAGDQMEVTLRDGTTRTLPVVGTYDIEMMGLRPTPGLGPLLPTALSLELAQPETVQFFLTAPAGQVQQAVAELGAALPQSTVISLPAYAARFTQVYFNLFVFAAAMAGLALVAGGLLIANSVSLAMLDRRYEIGVLKAVGYARRQVLFTLVVEYVLVAVIATGTGMAAVQTFTWIFGIFNPLARGILSMSPVSALVIAILSLGMTLLTVLGVTWRPVQVSPVMILNDRE